MLKSLTVNNFTIIKESQLEFSNGMSTITGETGAGKSILIGALGLALGQRAQSHYVGDDGKLSVILNIELDNLAKVETWLEQHDLARDKECILRRVLTPDGRSRAFINGVQVPLVQLQALSSQLIEIVGQNTQQSLMQPSKQLNILDMKCGHADILHELKKIQQKWNLLSQKLKQQLDKNIESKDRITLLKYQIDELQEFTPSNDDFQEIDQTYKRLSKKEQFQEQAYKALEILKETETSNVSSQIVAATRSLQTLTDTDTIITTAINQLDIALDHIQIATQEIRVSLERIKVDEYEYNALEKRLQGYFDLSRKYATKPENLGELYKDLKKELDELGKLNTSSQEIKRQIAELKARYLILADKLSKRRRSVAKTLSKQVTQILGELNMQGAEFSIVFKPHKDDTPKFHGQEQAEFSIRTNLGQPPAPLAQIASGGELSRISLAIQSAFTAKHSTPTLVFDEVDAGVGGKTADMVGKLLKKISTYTQVFCVTHLPQVAAQANHHFVVNKREENGHTYITVSKLPTAERRQEIARMVAGATITEKSLAHADEMLNQSNL